MKIAYGTYAMPAHMLEDAIPILARIGYDGVEIAVGRATPGRCRTHYPEQAHSHTGVA